MARKTNDLETFAKKHVPRTNPETRPPLIAPKRAVGSQQLPALSDLQLLKEGRGTQSIEPQPDPEIVAAEHIYFYDDRLLKEYRIVDRTYVMQEVQNETDAVLHRRTKSGRNLTYVLKVVQPPARARACGSGDKASTDRRPVDPPPVVRLQILCGDVDITASYESSFMLFASLEHARPYARGTLAATNHFAVLKGLAVAGAAYLAKPISAAYFIFPDLSVQHEGYYRLKFHLFESARPDDWDIGHERQIYQDGFEDAPPPDDQLAMRCMTYVYSRPFTVYSAKKFPGLAQSTELSRIIADQGCRVRIRRDIRQRRSEPKHTKKEDGHAPLRAETQTSVDSVQPLEQWNRPPAPDTRRPSADSQISQKYTPTQQPPHSQGSLRSPSIAGSSNRYQSIGPCNSAVIPPSPLVAEPDDMYASSLPPMRPTVAPPQAQPQSLAPPTPWASQPSPRSPTQSFPSCALPPIESLLNPQSPRPPGGLYATTPLAQKRGHSTSREERSAAFKDGARPQLTPISRINPYPYGVPALTASGPLSKTPLVGVNQIIEADDEEEDDDTHSVDSLLEFTNSYRRADGTKHNISTAKHSYEQ